MRFAIATAIGVAALAGSAAAQPGRPSTLSVTLVNQSDVTITHLTGSGGCNGRPMSVSAAPGRKASFMIYFEGNCGQRTSATGIQAWTETNTAIPCPTLYRGGAYITGRAGSYNCVSAPYEP